MNRRWSGVVIFVVFAGVVAIWAASLWIVPHAANLLGHVPAPCDSASGSCNNLAAYGLVGDLFGAVNSLFSGLALAAIALTLWVESRSRRESKKPLVLGSLERASGVELFPPDSQRDGALPLKIAISLQNQTADAALNVGVVVKIKRRTLSASSSVDEPLLHQAVHELTTELLLLGEVLEYCLTTLTSKNALDIVVVTKYRSLEGVNWKTSVTYQLHCNSTRDITILNSLRAGTAGAWPSGATVALQSRLESGSWDHSLA